MRGTKKGEYEFSFAGTLPHVGTEETGLEFYYSINMLENMTRFKQVSASLEINVMYAYLIIPISMAVTTFRVLQGLYRDFRNHTLHFQGRGD